MGFLQIIGPLHCPIITPHAVSERLADAIDLIVVLRLRKRQQFGLKHGKPVCTPWEVHQTGFELRLLKIESANFVAFDWNGLDDKHADLPEFLCKRSSG